MTTETRTPPATLSVDEAAEVLSIGRALAYETIAKTGELAGVRIIRVGRRIRVPRYPLMESLGLTDGDR